MFKFWICTVYEYDCCSFSEIFFGITSKDMFC